MVLEEFRKEFLDEIRTDAAINSTYPEDEFKSKTFELLDSIGELLEPVQYYFGKTFSGNRTMQIDGYCFNDAEFSMTLIISDFEDAYEPEDINRKQIEDVLVRRLNNFLEMSYYGKIGGYCDDSDEILKLAKLIRARLDDKISGILKIKFCIVTNKKLSEKVKKIKGDSFLDKPIEVNIWHIERFLEISNQNDNESIVINFKNDFQTKGIPCLKGDVGENLGYTAYIAIIPGKLLADIYIEHGSRILEGNVRAFLGTNGAKSVNAGIKKTAVNEPTKFFTYNNGIAVTASRAEVQDNDGELIITELEDMQIINGGQTTASLANAVLKKDNPNLYGIFVPMKLTVIEDRETVNDEGIKMYDQMVSSISRYANSQNKITAADLFSNNPYHVIMERMSKRYFAQPAGGSLNPTGWYYERTRKKYDQEQIKMTKAQREKFISKFPKKQVIRKEELAKYIYSTECKPNIVSKGKNWTMKDFGASINETYKKSKDTFNEFYFHKCVGATIIFRTVDKVVAHAPWYQTGGYKVNIVPYTIAKIMSSIPKGYSIDWQKIWKNQSLDSSFIREIEIVSKMTNDFIVDSHGMIVTEYCKREDTWIKYRDDINYKLGDTFIKDLVSSELMIEDEVSAKKEQKQFDKISAEMEIYKLGAHYWEKLLDKASEVGALNYKEISQLKVAAEMNETGKTPSQAQAKAILGVKQKLELMGIFAKTESAS